MPRTALIIDWLIAYGGAERTLATLSEMWPAAPIYTLIHDPKGQCSVFSRHHTVQTSFLQRFPGSIRNYRSCLMLMPLAMEQFDLREYELILSVSHAVAHGVLTRPDQLHIAYICSPPRYAWHQYHQYVQAKQIRRGPKAWLAKLGLHYLRIWDVAAANRIDDFIAISRWTARNVWKAYRREAAVIYPPVDVDSFEVQEKKENFYLTVSRLVNHKRVDLIVQAFAAMPQRKLIVIGDGPEREKLAAHSPKNIEILGYQPEAVVRDYYKRARAFLQASEEDFGIAAVEAQACGTPVIAYGSGGALETVLEGETGMYFREQSPENIETSINEFENMKGHFSPPIIRQHAATFSKAHFLEQIEHYINQKWEQFCA